LAEPEVTKCENGRLRALVEERDAVRDISRGAPWPAKRETGDVDPGLRAIHRMSSYAAARDLLASVRWRNKIPGAENISRDV
jgi:hypothetical protein